MIIEVIKTRQLLKRLKRYLLRNLEGVWPRMTIVTKNFTKLRTWDAFFVSHVFTELFDPKYRDVIFLEPPLNLVSFFSKEMTTCLSLADSWKRSAK